MIQHIKEGFGFRMTVYVSAALDELEGGERKEGRRRGASVGSGSTHCIEVYYCSVGRADSCSILPIGSVCVSVVTPLCVTHTHTHTCTQCTA